MILKNLLTFISLLRFFVCFYFLLLKLIWLVELGTVYDSNSCRYSLNDLIGLHIYSDEFIILWLLVSGYYYRQKKSHIYIFRENAEKRHIYTEKRQKK